MRILVTVVLIASLELLIVSAGFHIPLTSLKGFITHLLVFVCMLAIFMLIYSEHRAIFPSNDKEIVYLLIAFGSIVVLGFIWQ